MLKNAKRSVETFKNYVSYIHTFNLTDIFKTRERKGKKEKKLTFKSSVPELFYKNGVLKNFSKFTGKHLSQTEAALQKCS